ncbi:MAG: PD-(D/E)XK nuclease family protein, partial [Candidatus Sericytochromatia bacterium]|nr:PD-(D/E)XK nuclease family protein [Candidatus Tanganyikabacteria bacterium]
MRESYHAVGGNVPLNLLLGGAGAGKTWACLDEMRAALADGGRLILLVPEQASHQTERLALDMLGASHRYQVLSFRRLAWRVFQVAGGAARPPISELGRQMVLRAILGRRRPELAYFGALADRPGVIDHLSRALRECRTYELGPFELLAAADSWGGQRSAMMLPAKLRDLATIMTDLDAHLAGKYTDPDQALSRCAERLPRSGLADGSRIWVDGFTGFTPQEYRVLAALLARAHGLTVTLCLDPRGTYDGAGLFAPTHDTRERLLLMAGRSGHAVAERNVGAPGRGRFAAPGLAHLERSFFAPGTDVYREAAPEVTLVQAPGARAECAAIAREILRLCREEEFRLREIAVMVRDPGTYHPLLEAALSEHGVPCFVDRRRSVAYHGLVELLRSAVEIVAEDWRYEALFRFLKTDLGATVRRDQVDRLENLALEYGLRGHARWTGGDWPGPPWLAELRDRAVAPLARFHGRISGGGSRSVTEICRALYGLLEDLDVPRRLGRWAQEAEEAGHLELAAEHLQVHDAILDLLDQLVEALGDMAVTTREFLPLLEAGLAGLQLGMVPPSLDQVVVGSVERTRQPGLRAVFVAGASEGAFPRAEDEDLVFDDSERAVLAARGLELGPTSHERLLSEPFAMYLALTRASERLYLCHSEADASGRPRPPSPLWTRTRALLPRCRMLGAPDPAADPAAIATVGQLAQVVARRLAEGAGPEPWSRLRAWIEDDPARLAAAAPALGASIWSNAADDLPGDLAAELYGESLVVSASRLEAMAACPFMHFVRYGLRLAERPRFRVEPVDVGRFLHGALDRLVRALLADGADLAALATEERRRRVAEAVAAEV